MQKGQALTEALILLVLLAALFMAVTWLGKLQDIGLQLNHASRHNAFKIAYQKQDLSTDSYLADYLSNSRWARQDGANLIGDFELAITPTEINPYKYANKKFVSSLALFDELKLVDKNLWQITASTNTAERNRPDLRLSRFTTILRDVPSIKDDAQVQTNLANSNSAWRRNSDQSIRLGQELTSRLKGLDKAWNRSLPDWDWLKSWTGEVPRRHLKAGGSL